MPLQTTVHESWSKVDQAAWDSLVGERSPFLEHAFLAGLELTGCACPETGWTPQVITVSDGERLVAGIPAWRVTHDTGQFVWQGHWKRAADEAELPLHPKIVVGVPFTPVTGARLLLRPEHPEAARPALQALSDAVRGCHGLHVLFPDHTELAGWTRAGLFAREQYQFHWHNRGYADFDAFLADFRSKRRKEIRRERREVAHLQLDVVEAPDAALIDHLWDAYNDTVERNGGTDRFLKRAFFEHLGGAWPHRLLAVRARDGGRFIAGALDVVKGDRLYGRYWGQLEDVRFLHFEVCYHQGIDHCIARGLQAFEPGHGGDHKFRRGFLPARTHSAHLFPHRGVHRSFERASVRETAWFEDRIAELMAQSPLREG